MIIKKIHIKKLNISIINCRKYESFVEDKFCNHCGSLNVIFNNSIDCKFKPKLDFQKIMEHQSISDIERLHQEFRETEANKKIRRNFIDIIKKKDNKGKKKKLIPY